MPLTPVPNCLIHIEADYITVSLPASDKNAHPEVTAKASTEVVLSEIYGVAQPTIMTPLGTMPRGLRYVSADRTLYTVEYEAGPVGVFLPKWMVKSPTERFVILHMPKHYISVKFNNEFSSIIAAALSVSYDYNYTTKDPVQGMFGMKSFELSLVPTPNLSTSFQTIGSFLDTLQERIFGQAFALLSENELDWSVGSASLPIQYTPEIAEKMSFLEFWESQGTMVYDWTFSEPPMSTLASIMYLDADSGPTLDISSMEYPDVILVLMDLVKKHNKLPMLKKAEKLYAEAYEAWKKWRDENAGYDSTIVNPFPRTDVNDAILLSA